MIGRTEMPSSSMRKGYSLVPWLDPAVLTTLIRRVDSWLMTRWSSRITQSETYSSSPWRVRVASPRSPVTMAVMLAVLQPLEQPADLGPQHGLIRQSPEERFDRVEHDAFGADRINRMPEADEQAFEVVLTALLDVVGLDMHVIDGDLLPADHPGEIESQRRDILFDVPGPLLERHEHAGLAELQRSANQELDRQQALAAAGGAAHQRRPSTRKSTAGHLVESLDAGRRLRERDSGR